MTTTLVRDKFVRRHRLIQCTYLPAYTIVTKKVYLLNQALCTISVTRLGDFLKFLSINFGPKVPQIFDNSLGY